MDALPTESRGNTESSKLSRREAQAVLGLLGKTSLQQSSATGVRQPIAPDRGGSACMRHGVWKLLLFAGLLFTLAGCGGGAGPAHTTNGSAAASAPCDAPSASAASPSGLPSVQVSHLFMVVEENEAYDDVIGNTADMPYLNSLAKMYAYSKGYFANAHPSLPDYFLLTAGISVTDTDSYSQTVSADNIVRHLIAAGLSWKEYSESLPYAGYAGGDTTDGYYQRHNPLSYFSDVRNSSSEEQNLVPFTQLATDLADHTLPNYALIIPNGFDDAHDCPDGGSSCTNNQKLAAADRWLQTNIEPLIESSDFNAPGGGMLIITFDESYDSDTVMGGGKVAWVLVGPDVKKGYVSATCFQHPSTLRFMSEVLGLKSYPGAAASSPSMRQFLIGN